ncbi:MAG: response regulator [Candidatus Peribacteraceae bacterium]|nr:response regulator [Candidatus Peribacteraceae bacterium]MBP9850080.1 response regulator [Candidatus Peribacteraceae bacterium]
MAQYKLLVAEDDTVLRDLYLRKFDRNVYDVRTAVNGQEVLDLIAKEKPDLLLLDINMPVLDGLGVLERLPKAERTYPVIILTNFDDQANRERGKAYQVDDYYVKKDMTIKSLVDMVERLIKKPSA